MSITATVHTSKGDRALRSLINTEKGTINRELYVNEDIFAQEMEQIYRRCWLFLGHETLVPNPGDFCVSRMGTEEVILVRDRSDNQIRAFLNTCRHRGEKVCRYDQGNTLLFTCPFHAWSYDTSGRLIGAAGINHPLSYGGALDKNDWGLVEVAQFTNYYGTLWATWDKNAPSFEDYLGPFADSVRYMCEASDGTEAGLEVFTPFQRWRLPTNWKVPAFTSSRDPEHGAMTHRSVNAAAIGPMRERQGGQRHVQRKLLPNNKYVAGDHNLGHGGDWTEYLEPGISEYVDAWYEEGVDDYFREAHQRKAAKYANRIAPPQGHDAGHICVWPNFIMDSWRWRIWHPHSAGVVERWSLFGVDKAAPKHVKDAVRHYVMRYNGPTGATESDDMENWNYVYPASRGAIAREWDYNFANGFGRGVERPEYPAGLVFNTSRTEEAHRARFSRWLAFMEAESWDELYPVNPAANHRIW
ncbi:MAG: Rieske 2Fe-2S domain-containing protein [Acidimicrobiaceae bacterium]|nr:Rieske 2Fe-2S domain-containing protein [Acidimicrobiaceae bacterium]